ncbi:ABC transporter permease subunit [Paenibacillus sp. HJL G12]|uniref:ABC transporter permease subunit n=1 Tax=Paenibacillus dendrobii TaxID=2691084 RepID=A0A7X3IGU5_9BACL|nr:ABC transporter permease [Paenibacillus dendrobii]MWV43211.1 ABC transporter permease subunit [Paenibacillus dendrobii]
MMALLHSEWERLWKRKIAWLFLIAIPCIIVATAKYYLGHNVGIPPGSPEITTAENFPVMAMIEQLIIVFNVVALILLTLSFTEEYRSGQLRMIMLRAYSSSQLFWAKWIAFALMMALFFIIYLLAAVLAGYLLFKSAPQQILFYYDHAVPNGDMILYTLRYYGMAYASIVGMASVFIGIGVISRSSTAAIGLGMGFLLCSLGFPLVFEMSNRVLGLNLPGMLKYLSLSEIQFSGIAVMMSNADALKGVHAGIWMICVIAGYTAVFMTASRLIFTKSDRWI